MCTTTPMTKTLPLWTSSLETQRYLVRHTSTLQFKSINKCCVAEFERSPKMTWLDFVSGFGGLCGLCLGISFVSIAEILYWFSLRLCRNFWSIPRIICLIIVQQTTIQCSLFCAIVSGVICVVSSFKITKNARAKDVSAAQRKIWFLAQDPYTMTVQCTCTHLFGSTR